jgi:Collagen triple helix repeat (20 copies)
MSLFPRRALLLLFVLCAALITSGTASAACIARPLVLLHASTGAGRTTVKLPAFLRATLICGEARGPRGWRGFTGTRGAAGLIGVMGPVGATGATGATGAPGTNGATGAQGQPGAAGTNGTNGSQGLRGDAGTNGTNGTNGTSVTPDYAYFYDASAQTVAGSGDVLFTVNGPVTSEFVHPAGSAFITFVTSGTFKVLFSVTGAGRNQVALTLDSVPVAGSMYGSDDTAEQNTGQIIMTVAAGQVITLRNQNATTGIVLDNTAGGLAINVDASMLIERLA